MAAAVEQGFSDTDTQTALLFRDHYQRVLRAAFKITGSMADAEDIAQTVFARVAVGGASQACIANPKSYFYRAALNAALDLVRQRQRENSVSLDAANEHTGRVAPDQVAIKDALRRALASVEGRAAEMFAMRYLEDCDLGEIARAFETSRAVVAVTLHRTRARLRKQLQDAVRGK